MPAPFVQPVTAKGEIIDTKALPRNEVLLNVYNVGQGTAVKRINMVNFVGGVFHGGIEVYNMEYCYGGHDDWSTGIGKCNPRAHPCHDYRETVRMGQTKLNQMAVEKVIKELVTSGEWAGVLYKFIGHNCLDFCSALTIKLGVGRIPAFYDRYGRTAEKVLVNPFNAAKRVLGRKKTEDALQKPDYMMGKMFSQSCCAIDLRDVVSDDDSDESMYGKTQSMRTRRFSQSDAHLVSIADRMNDGTLGQHVSPYGKSEAKLASPQSDATKRRAAPKSNRQVAPKSKANSKSSSEAKVPQTRDQFFSALFDAFDRDADGHLSKLELLRFLECGGMEATPKEFREIYANMCSEAGAEPSRGIDKKQMKSLSSDMTKKQFESMYAKRLGPGDGSTRTSSPKAKAKAKPKSKVASKDSKQSRENSQSDKHHSSTKPSPTPRKSVKDSKDDESQGDQCRVERGMCKMGCGRSAAKNKQGRFFDTCCKGCATGDRHSLICEARFQKESNAGLCKMGCGRKVANSNGDRTFDTCCRGCATGGEHSSKCTAENIVPDGQSAKNVKGPPKAQKELPAQMCQKVAASAPEESADLQAKDSPAASVREGTATSEDIGSTIFCCFDRDRDHLLNPTELRKFVESIGFEGSDDDWSEWYQNACVQVSAEIARGVNEDQFLKLIEDLEETSINKLLADLKLVKRSPSDQRDGVDGSACESSKNLAEVLKNSADMQGHIHEEMCPLDSGLHKMTECLPVNDCISGASQAEGNVVAEDLHTRVIDDDRELFRAAMSQICTSKAQGGFKEASESVANARTAIPTLPYEATNESLGIVSL